MDPPKLRGRGHKEAVHEDPALADHEGRADTGAVGLEELQEEEVPLRVVQEELQGDNPEAEPVQRRASGSVRDAAGACDSAGRLGGDQQGEKRVQAECVHILKEVNYF